MLTKEEFLDLLFTAFDAARERMAELVRNFKSSDIQVECLPRLLGVAESSVSYEPLNTCGAPVLPRPRRFLIARKPEYG